MSTPTYANFDLLLDRGPTGYRARVIRSLAGEASTDFALPFTEEELVDFLWRTASGTRHLGVAPDESGSALDPRGFGARLYAAAFAGPVGLCLRRSLDEAERRGVGLRLRLRLDAGVLDLAELPWEFLFVPDLDRFLALSDLTPIVRYVELDRPVQPLRARLPLTVLAIVSNPSGVQPLALEREWQNLQGALSPLVQRGVIALERLETATLPALQARLRRGPVDLLHFVGHGFFDAKSNTGGLVFENERGQSEIVTAETLGMLLHDHEALRLIFLNACEGAQGGRSDPFAGIAQRLAQQGAPAVLAMQFLVTDAAAIALSQAFYQALADGLPADAALSQARKAIAARSKDWEWGTPVLFSRSDDNRLIEYAEDDSRQGVRVAAPPEPMPPPNSAGFVGREQELAYFASSLAADHIAVIAGMAGLGKTALATRLARQVAKSPDRIFWHQFHEGEGIETIIWRLAGMLYRHDRKALWELLEGTRQNGGQPPLAEVLLDYLVQLLRGQDYVLCLDDFHHAEEDPLVEKAVDRLQPLLLVGEVTLIVTSRRMPVALKTLSFVPLGGLDLADARGLLAAREVTLMPDLLVELHQRTDGNAELLTLAAHALRRNRHPEQIVKRLADEDDVETFLLKKVDEGLTTDQRQAMSGVAALLGYPGTRDAIEATLAGGSLKRTLRYLANRFLLREQDGPLDQEYLIHAIVQAFYYDLLSRKERQEMHRRAGEYYEHEEPDLLRAAMHYQRGGNAVRAAELATTDVWGAIHKGHAQAQQHVLEQFAPAQVSPAQWAQIQLRLGEIHQHFRRSSQARSSYEHALSTLDAVADSPSARAQRAMICRRVGQLLGYESPIEAMTWTQRGLELVGEDDRFERAALLVQKGALHALVADFDVAEEAVQEGLALVEGEIGQVTVDGLTNLGNIYSTRGDVEQGRVFTERALVLARQLHDPFRALKLTISLGADMYDAGDQAGGLAETRKALALARELGVVKEQALITLNLGDMLREQGDLEAAAEYTAECLHLAQQGQLRRVEVAALTNLAHIALAQGSSSLAYDHLVAAEILAEQIGADDALPEVFVAQAEVSLAQDDAAGAVDWVEKAILLAQQLGLTVELDAAQRLRSEIAIEFAEFPESPGRKDAARVEQNASSRNL